MSNKKDSNEPTGTPTVELNGHRVRLSEKTWMMLWSIFLSVIAGMAFVVRLDAKVEQWISVSEITRLKVDSHCTSDGHPVALERTKAALQRIEALEKEKKP